MVNELRLNKLESRIEYEFVSAVEFVLIHKLFVKKSARRTNGRGHAPSELAFWYATCSHMNCSHDATFPPPVSVLNAWRPLQRSHSASGAHALSMLFVTHSSCVPL